MSSTKHISCEIMCNNLMLAKKKGSTECGIRNMIETSTKTVANHWTSVLDYWRFNELVLLNKEQFNHEVLTTYCDRLGSIPRYSISAGVSSTSSSPWEITRVYSGKLTLSAQYGNIRIFLPNLSSNTSTKADISSTLTELGKLEPITWCDHSQSIELMLLNQTYVHVHAQVWPQSLYFTQF